MRKIILVLSIITCGVSYGGQLYVGASLGASHSEHAKSNINDGLSVLASLGASSAATADQGAIAVGINGGYQFNDNLAIDADYTYLGTYQVNLAFSGGVSGTYKEEDKVGALSLSAIPSVRLSNVAALFGRIGIAISNIEQSCDLSIGSCSSTSDSKTGPLYGIGLNIRSNENLDLRFEYDRYQDVGNTNHDYTAGPFGLIRATAILYL